MFEGALNTPMQTTGNNNFDVTFNYKLKKNGTIWDKNGPNKICGRVSLKNLKGYGLLKQTICLRILKDCLPQILLGPFLNTLSQI